MIAYSRWLSYQLISMERSSLVVLKVAHSSQIVDIVQSLTQPFAIFKQVRVITGCYYSKINGTNHAYVIETNGRTKSCDGQFDWHCDLSKYGS